MPIAPRVIPQNRPTPAPTPTPAPQPTSAEPTPTPTPALGQTRTQAQPPSSSQSPAANSAPPAARTPAPTATSRTPERQPAAAPTSPPEAQPDPETLVEELPELPNDTGPAAPDEEWYSVDNIGAESSDGATATTDSSSAGPSEGATDFGGIGLSQSQIWAAIAAVLALLAGLAFWQWRKRRIADDPLELPAPTLTAGVRRSIAATHGSPNTQVPPEPLDLTNQVPDEPVSAPPPPTAPAAAVPSPEPEEPWNLDVTLEVVSASRSVMMFSLEYRVNLANRSDRAVRDITIASQLVCAQRGMPNAAPTAGSHPLGGINRIGPQQSSAITGQTQMPLTEVHAIQQGGKPLFVPLLYIRVESAGQETLTRRFIVGNPSSTSQGRLHPIRLDTPPGGLPDLQVREVKVDAA